MRLSGGQEVRRGWSRWGERAGKGVEGLDLDICQGPRIPSYATGGVTIRYVIVITRKPHGSIFCRTGVMCDRIFTLRIQGFSTFFAPVTSTLTRWPLYTKMTRIRWRYSGCANMNFLSQGFRKSSSDRQTDTETGRQMLRWSTRKDGDCDALQLQAAPRRVSFKSSQVKSSQV